MTIAIVNFTVYSNSIRLSEAIAERAHKRNRSAYQSCAIWWLYKKQRKRNALYTDKWL